MSSVDLFSDKMGQSLNMTGTDRGRGDGVALRYKFTMSKLFTVHNLLVVPDLLCS